MLLLLIQQPTGSSITQKQSLGERKGKCYIKEMSVLKNKGGVHDVKF